MTGYRKPPFDTTRPVNYPVCPHCGKPLSNARDGQTPGTKRKNQLCYEFYQAGLSWSAVAKQVGYPNKNYAGTVRQMAWDYAQPRKLPFPPPRVEQNEIPKWYDE